MRYLRGRCGALASWFSSGRGVLAYRRAFNWLTSRKGMLVTAIHLLATQHCMSHRNGGCQDVQRFVTVLLFTQDPYLLIRRAIYLTSRINHYQVQLRHTEVQFPLHDYGTRRIRAGDSDTNNNKIEGVWYLHGGARPRRYNDELGSGREYMLVGTACITSAHPRARQNTD